MACEARGDALLESIDAALDAAEASGRIRYASRGPEHRALTRRVLEMLLDADITDAPVFFSLPPLPQPPMTAVLVMDRETRRQLSAACHVCSGGGCIGSQVDVYGGVPVVVNDDAAGRVYLVTLQQMSEDN